MQGEEAELRKKHGERKKLLPSAIIAISTAAALSTAATFPTAATFSTAAFFPETLTDNTKFYITDVDDGGSSEW